jgi:hypothetical protein
MAQDTIKEIVLNGTKAQKLFLYGFTKDDTNDTIVKKFRIWSRANYPRYFTDKESPEHKVMVLNYVKSYRGQCNGIEIAFRGFGKTSILKLFIAYVILNDQDQYRRYIKILSRDLKNSKQMVTDIYNLIIEVQDLYGDVFEKEGDKKREETMGSFTTKKMQKLTAGTVGQTQRGHLQDAYRPDWAIFEDIEDRETVSSIVMTEGIIQKCDEAISGLSFDGTYQVNANYISDSGSIQWFLNKPGINAHIVPITVAGVPTWDRYTSEKIEEIKRESDFFETEYMCNPTLAGDKFFDIERIEKDLLLCTEPIATSAGVRYWEKYRPDGRYGMGMDLSDGVGKDSCAFSIFNFASPNRTLLVSTYDTNELSPDLFTYDAIRVGQEFGNCIIAPEINNTCGGVAISVLKEKSYPHIYTKEITDKLGNTMTKTIGWHTNSKTKTDALFEFKRDYEKGLIEIRDARLLKEMKAYRKSDLKEKVSSSVTRHFDLLMSALIGFQMKDRASYANSIKDFYSNLKNKSTGSGKGARS